MTVGLRTGAPRCASLLLAMVPFVRVAQSYICEGQVPQGRALSRFIDWFPAQQEPLGSEGRRKERRRIFAVMSWEPQRANGKMVFKG